MRKNILRTFMAAVLFGVILTVSAWADEAVVTGNGVNMRSGPGTGYSVVDCLPKGSTVTVTDRSNASWYGVSYNGVTGFMSASYLSITQNNYGSVTESSGSAYINAMYVRFRSGPASTYSILGEYNTGKTVTVTGISGDWTQCTIDGNSGYIYSKYVTNGAYSGNTGSTGSSSNSDAYSGTYGDNSTNTSGDASGSTDNGNTGYGGEYSGTTGLVPTVTPVPVAPVATPVPTAAPEATFAPVATPSPLPTAAPTGTGGYINANYVRFRTGPSTGYSIINTYNKGQQLTITGVSGDWTQCVIDGNSGYVYTAYVTKNAPVAVATPAPTAITGTGESTQKDGYITGNNVRFRSGPSMTSTVIGEFYYGNSVIISGVSGEWTMVVSDGKTGYVYSSYVKEGTYTYTAPSSTPTTTTSNPDGTATGEDVATFAQQFKGYSYTWGGTSPSVGFDCSGLVYYCYQQYGYTLHRVAADQATDGVAVTGDLKPGDILCFYSGGGYIGHAGIYIGDDMFIHAANSESGVIITQLSGWYTERGYEARRIIN